MPHDPVRPRALACHVIRALFFLALSSTSHASAQKTQTNGVFTDRTGKTHLWSVAQSHALVWDGETFIPMGGIFAPRYLGGGQTEENWTKDAAALDLLKSKGVADLIIDPTISAADVPAAAWQRVIDYLDGHGFHYGISFGTGVGQPLVGTVVKPARYRVQVLHDNEGTTWRLTSSDSARYFFADGQDGSQILTDGHAIVRDGEVSVQPNQKVGAGAIGVIYPHRTIKPGRDGGLPNIWTGFDSYRDKLVALFAGIKFGPGLRFFLDPLAHPLNIAADETDYLIPDSAAFALEWEGWLVSHYPVIDDLMNAWGMQDREIKEFKVAARLVPLFADGRGLPFLVDPSTGKRYETRGNGARFWTDFRDFRDSSLAWYMNAISDVLKREIANVPVVYTRSSQERIFTNDGRGGFDGLGIAAYARGSALVTSGADSTVSQAAAATRPMWCFVSETMDTNSAAKADVGYASKEAMFYDLDWLRKVGAKGFFVNGFQLLPEETWRNFELLRAPDQIGWIKEYGDRLSRSVVAESAPNTLPYPPAAAGFIPSGPIANSNVMWVPSLYDGKPLLFGGSYAGYTIDLPTGKETVLWSLRGARETHLMVGDVRKVRLTTPDGAPIKPPKMDVKKKEVILPISDTPIIIRDNDAEIFPVEACEDALILLNGLVKQAEAAKLPSATEQKFMYDRAMNQYKLKDPKLAFAMAAESINAVVREVQPYTWIEAERADAQTFSEVVPNPAASGEAYLNLDTDSRPGTSGYGAEYRFSVPADDTYSVWIACTPPGPQSSPFSWVIDQDQFHASTAAALVGAEYLSNHFGWMNLGRVPLTKGSHTFTLRITEPAASGRYAFAADAILVTRSLFMPNGVARPSLLGPLESSRRIQDLDAKEKKTTPKPAKGNAKK